FSFLLACIALAPAARAAELGAEDVVVVGRLSDADQIVLTANLAAARFRGALLWDSAQFAKANDNFVSAFQSRSVVRVSSAAEARALEKTLVAGQAFSRAVVCPAEPRRLLLQAAHLAGAL